MALPPPPPPDPLLNPSEQAIQIWNDILEEIKRIAKANPTRPPVAPPLPAPPLVQPPLDPARRPNDPLPPARDAVRTARDQTNPPYDPSGRPGDRPVTPPRDPEVQNLTKALLNFIGGYGRQITAAREPIATSDYVIGQMSRRFTNYADQSLMSYRQRIHDLGLGTGMNLEESIKYTQIAGRYGTAAYYGRGARGTTSTGGFGSFDQGDQLRYATQAAFNLGMNRDQYASTLTALGQSGAVGAAGTAGGQKQDYKEFAVIVAETLSAGRLFDRMDDVMRSIESLATEINNRGGIVDPAGLASAIASANLSAVSTGSARLQERAPQLLGDISRISASQLNDPLSFGMYLQNFGTIQPGTMSTQDLLKFQEVLTGGDFAGQAQIMSRRFSEFGGNLSEIQGNDLRPSQLSDPSALALMAMARQFQMPAGNLLDMLRISGGVGGNLADQKLETLRQSSVYQNLVKGDSPGATQSYARIAMAQDQDLPNVITELLAKMDRAFPSNLRLDPGTEQGKLYTVLQTQLEEVHKGNISSARQALLSGIAANPKATAFNQENALEGFKVQTTELSIAINNLASNVNQLSAALGINRTEATGLRFVAGQGAAGYANPANAAFAGTGGQFIQAATVGTGAITVSKYQEAIANKTDTLTSVFASSAATALGTRISGKGLKMGLGGAAIIGAGEIGGEYLKEQQNPSSRKLGAVLEVLSATAGGALTGFSVAGPWGAAGGAALMGGLQLINNRDILFGSGKRGGGAGGGADSPDASATTSTDIGEVLLAQALLLRESVGHLASIETLLKNDKITGGTADAITPTGGGRRIPVSDAYVSTMVPAVAGTASKGAAAGSTAAARGSVVPGGEAAVPGGGVATAKAPSGPTTTYAPGGRRQVGPSLQYDKVDPTDPTLRRILPGGGKADYYSSDPGIMPSLLPGMKPEWADAIQEAAQTAGVDPAFIMAIMQQENRPFDPSAVSTEGAVGLMQILPSTARGVVPEWSSLSDDEIKQKLKDPITNIKTGGRTFAGKRLSNKNKLDNQTGLQGEHDEIVLSSAFFGWGTSPDGMDNNEYSRQFMERLRRIRAGSMGAPAAPATPATAPSGAGGGLDRAFPIRMANGAAAPMQLNTGFFQRYSVMGRTMWNMGPDLAPSAVGANDMIVAPEGGTIIGIQKNDDLDNDQLSELDPNGGGAIDNAYGNSVLIKGNDGVLHRLSHLADLQNLQLGQHVSAGDALGHIGSTGFATGTHLDWETWAAIKMHNNRTGIDMPGYQIMDPIEWYKNNQWKFAPFRQKYDKDTGVYQPDDTRITVAPSGAAVLDAKDLNNAVISPGGKVTAGGGGSDNSSPHQLQIVIRLEQGSDGTIIGTIGGPDTYLLAFNNQDPLAGRFPGAYSGPPVFAVSPTVVP